VQRLLFDFGTLPETEQNSLLWFALHPAARERVVNWEEEVRTYFGRFRAAMAHNSEDPRIQEVFDRIEHGPSDVRDLWASREYKNSPSHDANYATRNSARKTSSLMFSS
jgi:hypothetical protein